MECSSIINSIGLLFDIGGAILIFIYGLAPHIKESMDGQLYMHSGEGVELERIKTKKFRILSYLGLTFLILGFLLQLVSNFIK
jgi:hypothetical protein